MEAYSNTPNIESTWGSRPSGQTLSALELGFPRQQPSGPGGFISRAQEQDLPAYQIPPRHEAGAFDFPTTSRSVNSLSIVEQPSSFAERSSGIETVLQRIRSDPSLHAQASTSERRSANSDEDVFSSLGGVEMSQDIDVDHHLEQASAVSSQPDPTATPSRTLLVRNVAVDADEEELSSIFKSFGDVRNLYLGSKHSSGLVIVTYFDLRAAVSAKTTLHGTLVNNLPLEIHFSKQKRGTQDPYGLSQLQGSIVVYNLDPETTNDHLGFMFSNFGDVKDVSQSADRSSQKVVTFYDVRHAAAALKAMNRAEHLGKLPSHITPQQAASMAYITGSSPSLVQLAALQLQHDGQMSLPQGMVPGQWDQSGPSVDGLLKLVHPGQQQQHGMEHSPVFAPHAAGSPLNEMQLHVSDSASSIANAAQGATGQLFSSHGPSGLGKGLAVSMAAAAAAMVGRSAVPGSSNPPGSAAAPRPGSTGPGGMYQPGSSVSGPAGLDKNMQQLIMQSGMSATDAANMLMSLGLSSPEAPHGAPILGQHGEGRPPATGVPTGSGAGWSGGMYSGPQVPAGPNNSAAVMAALHEMQAMQVRQQQQQMAAAAQAQAQAQLASHLAGLQAQQQALAAAGMAAPGHHLAAAQLLQAAQMGMGGNPGGPGYLPHNFNAAAVQLLQQAGLAVPGLGGYAAGQAGRHPGSSGELSGPGGPGRGLDMSRGGGGGRLSRRTTDPVAEAERKAQQEKLYALNSERIYSGQDRRTTLMIKNIPNKYTQKMLLATIDEHFHGTYDFFYLPIDFKNKCNVGYAFINMTQPVHIIPLVERFNRKKWDRFNSEKVCNISYARIQGRSALISHFQNSSLMHEDKRCRPILFVLEGHEATGEQEAFPTPATGSVPSSASGGALHQAGPSAALSTVRSSMSNSSSHPNLTASSSLASIHESCGISSCGGSTKSVAK